MQLNELLLTSLSAHINQSEFPGVVFTEELFKAYIKKATKQKILPMTADAILKSENTEISDKSKMFLNNICKQQIISQMIRTKNFITVYNELLNNGLKPLCVKGIVCRSLYHEPDMRPSGDEDLIIEKKDFLKCCQILTTLGFTADKDNYDSFEICFVNKDLNCRIELHNSLFDPESNIFSEYNELTEDIFDDANSIEYDGSTIYTLENNKHLLYIILHAFKHFLHSGFGIRQLCDILLFSSSFSPDWNYIFSKCKEVNADIFLSTILLIGEQYFQYSLSDTPCLQEYINKSVSVTPLLDDILSGSIYGADSREREHSSTITLNSVAAYNNNENSSLMKSVFPPYKKMKIKYPYVERHRYLLPVSYIQRIFEYLRSGNSSAQTIEIGKSRTDLLRYYKIID